MNRFIFILILGFFGSVLNAQTGLVKVKPSSSFVWTYANLKGEIIIDGKKYMNLYPFSEDGYAVAYLPKEKQYVIIDRRGKQMITRIKKFQLKESLGFNAKGYSDGLIAINVMNKWGYMDTLGNIAVPVKYDDLSGFNSGHGIGKYGEKFVIVDRHGKETPIEDPSIIKIKEFSDSLAAFISDNGLYGFLNISGKILIPPQFISVGYFKDGYTWAKSNNGFFGLINTKGEWVIKPEFDILNQIDIESGLAKAKKGEQYGYANLNGEFITFPISDIWEDFHEGLTREKVDKLWGFLNNKGEWFMKPQYQGLHNFKNGYAAAKSGGFWGIIDKRGNWIIQPTFSAIGDVTVIH